jgi:hypothetical protein
MSTVPPAKAATRVGVIRERLALIYGAVGKFALYVLIATSPLSTSKAISARRQRRNGAVDLAVPAYNSTTLKRLGIMQILFVAYAVIKSKGCDGFPDQIRA